MDISGKHIAITGATAGIGRSAAIKLASRGAQLTLFCRNFDKGCALADEISAAGGSRPQIITMDMVDLSSVRRAAAEFLKMQKPLDVLLNNAGLISTSRNQTIDGFEETIAVNHYAPFLLTGLVLPAIARANKGRIVNVASDAYSFVKSMGFEDMQAEQSYKTFREYGRSKLANILFTRSLAKRLEKQAITVNCLHPGAVDTSLGDQNKGVVGKFMQRVVKPFFRSPDKGAETSIYLCCSDEVAAVSGQYFSNCKVKSLKPWAVDDNAAEKLWQHSEASVDFIYPV